MKLYSTTRGVARETSDGRLALLDIDAADLGALLTRDPLLAGLASAAEREVVAQGDVELLAPVPRPGTVYCVGANYESHVDEMRAVLEQLGRGADVAATIEGLRRTPLFFSVPATAVTGPRAPIVLPRIAPQQVDYEIEAAVIIGAGGKDIPEEDALGRIAGLTLANDVSARDIQARAMQSQEFEFAHAKGLDGFKPMGPCLVTLDELPCPLDVALETRVNDEPRQSANVADLLHDIPRCVSYISTFHTLRPGDVILTGSPAGVGFFRGTFLRAGDVVRMSASGIGELVNTVVEEGRA